jgi:drug/metabolite transporter (DMT)-like permease
VILAELVTWAALLGGAIILFGVWLVTTDPQKGRCKHR